MVYPPDSVYQMEWVPPKRAVPEIPDGAIYGAVTCLSQNEMDEEPIRERVDFQPLFEELLLRLEMTGEHEYLRVPFLDETYCKRALNAFHRHLQRRGIRHEVEAQHRRHYLYVRRTAVWGTTPDPDLVKIAHPERRTPEELQSDFDEWGDDDFAETDC